MGALAVVAIGGGVAMFAAPAGTPAPAATVPAAPSLGEAVPVSLDAERIFGRFRILPTGASPEHCGPPAPEGAVSVSVNRTTGTSLDPHRKNALFYEPRSVPAGYAVSNVESVTTTWSDGTTSDTSFVVEYAAAGREPLRFQMVALPKGCVVDVVNPGPGADEHLTLARVDG